MFRKNTNTIIVINDKLEINTGVPETTNYGDLELQKICNKIKIDNYHDLLKKLKEIKSAKKDKIYNIFYDNKKLLFAANNTAEILYNIENDEMDALLQKILRIDSEHFYATAVVNFGNYFQLITAPIILELLFEIAELKNKNIQPYYSFKLKCKNGKIRDITAPREEIKPILQDINKIFQNVYDKKNIDFQVAYKAGKNILSNAEIHKDNKYVYVTDLSNFFPSCSRNLVEPYISFLFNNSLNSEVLKNLFLDAILKDNSLFIGNPVSGTLANAIIHKPCAYLNNMCKKCDMSFSVYADDMTFSSNIFIHQTTIVNMFNEAFDYFKLSDNFKLNEKKLKGFSADRRHVTGIALNSDNKPTCKRHLYQTIRIELNKLSNNNKIKESIQKLRGKIAFATCVDTTKKVYRLLDKYKDTVTKYNLCSEEKMNNYRESIKLEEAK